MQITFFIETSPFTNWRITMPDTVSHGTPVNTDVDVSGVTKVEVFFSGSGLFRGRKKRLIGIA